MAPPSPGPGRSSRSAATIVALVIGGLALAVIGAFIGVRLHHDPERVDTRAGADASAVDRTGADAVVDDSAALDGPLEDGPLEPADAEEGSTIPDVATTATPTTVPVPLTPGQKLRLVLDEDRNQVEALMDYWVPMLSSKQIGVTDPVTHIFYGDDQSILGYHQELASQYRALLLWSGEYSTFTKGDFWVSVVPVAYGTAAEAEAWCVDHGINDSNFCNAKLLSHTHGTKNTNGPR